MMKSTRGIVLAVLVTGACGLAACDKSEDAKKSASSASPVVVTPKSAPANPGDAPQPANVPTPATGPADVASVAETPAASTPGAKRESAGGASWEMPAGWSRGPDAQMRLATIGDGAAEVAITSFLGNVGGVPLNINRWRSQVGLPPVKSDADAEKLLTDVDVNGRKIRVADMTGGSDRIIVAMVPADGKLYFFKMIGKSDVVAAHKAAFDQLVKTIRVE